MEYAWLSRRATFRERRNSRRDHIAVPSFRIGDQAGGKHLGGNLSPRRTVTALPPM
jgi:hypothetical protein